MTNDKLTAIKLKIKALAEKTVANGCTEHEALAAMAMVGKLLEQYNLSMDECDVRKQSCRTEYRDTFQQNRGAIDGCVVALANLFDAKVWTVKRFVDKQFRRHYAFFGTETDLEMLIYLYEVIEKAFKVEQANFKTSSVYRTARYKKTAYTSFGHGMAYRLSARLNEIKNAMKSPQAQGTAIIHLKNVLVEEEFVKMNLTIKKNYSHRRTGDSDSFYAGTAAGDRVNLNRPVNSNENRSRLS